MIKYSIGKNSLLLSTFRRLLLCIFKCIDISVTLMSSFIFIFILLVQPCSKAIFISYLILCNIDKTGDSPEIHGCVASVYVCEICVCECVSDTHGNGWDDGYGLSPLTKCRRTGAVFVLVTPWQKLRAHQDLHLGCQPKWPEWSLSALD